MSAGLRQLAEAATPGPWRAHGSNDDSSVRQVRDDLVGSRFNGIARCDGWNEESINGADEANAAFIAAANPRAVLALLDERDALAARVAAVEALHTPERRYQPHPDAEWSVSRPEDCEDEYGDVVTDPHVFEVCAECGRMEMLSDQHDPGDECPHAYQDSLWPCATIKALGAAGDEDRA